MKRTRVPAAKTALVTGLVSVALGLAGCSVTSPAVIKTPYPASDGIDADLPGTDVVLRNLIVIGAEKGAEAELIGSVINGGSTDARINLQAAVGESGQPSETTIAVAAGEHVQFGPGSAQTPVSISDLSVEPGDVTGLTASTTSGGRVDLSVPVLPPEGDYSAVTPAATPTSIATPGKQQSSNPDATATPSGDATTQPSGNKKRQQSTEEATSPEASETAG